MRKITVALSLLLLANLSVFAQAKTRKLPSIINHPSLSLYAPYISFEGDALLFLSNGGQDGSLILSYTSRESDWSTPVEIPKTLNTRINYLKGYALSADGKRMYYTSAKSPVIGGYDIFYADLNGTTWTAGTNMMLPINSKTNDGCPSLTPDGTMIYFMRCDKMDQNSADGCKIFFSKKKPNGQWEEPTELPASINTGNSQTPRIMADGETLIFSSNKIAGSKGGMDLYVSKLKNGNWSNPVPLDFVNTPSDDQFVSATALGRYLIKEAPGSRKNFELTEFLFPNEVRPRGLMKVEGKVTDPTNAPVPAYVSVVDLKNNSRVYSGRPQADGSYFVYLLEGTQYEMAVDPEQSNATFFSKQFDLTSDKIAQRERVNVTLKTPSAGDEIVLEQVRFKPHSSVLEPSSENELKKLARLAKANASLSFEIQVLLNGFEEDSVQSSPDLTEVVVDSILTQYDDIDSLGQLYKRDTLLVKTTYHNDRTLQQADAIVAFLSTQGVAPGKLKTFGNAIEAVLPENKKLTVKAVARK